MVHVSVQDRWLDLIPTRGHHCRATKPFASNMAAGFLLPKASVLTRCLMDNHGSLAPWLKQIAMTDNSMTTDLTFLLTYDLIWFNSGGWFDSIAVGVRCSNFEVTNTLDGRHESSVPACCRLCVVFPLRDGIRLRNQAGLQASAGLGWGLGTLYCGEGLESDCRLRDFKDGCSWGRGRDPTGQIFFASEPDLQRPAVKTHTAGTCFEAWGCGAGGGIGEKESSVTNPSARRFVEPWAPVEDYASHRVLQDSRL